MPHFLLFVFCNIFVLFQSLQVFRVKQWIIFLRLFLDLRCYKNRSRRPLFLNVHHCRKDVTESKDLNKKSCEIAGGKKLNKRWVLFSSTHPPPHPTLPVLAWSFSLGSAAFVQTLDVKMCWRRTKKRLGDTSTERKGARRIKVEIESTQGCVVIVKKETCSAYLSFLHHFIRYFTFLKPLNRFYCYCFLLNNHIIEC